MGWADDIAGALDDRRKGSAPPSKFSAADIESAISSTEPDAKASKWVPDSPAEQPKYTPPSAFNRFVTGPAEGALSVVSGIAGATAGAAAGVYKAFTGGKYGTKEGAAEASRHAAEVADSLTYRPRTQGGQEAVELAGSVIDATKIAGLGPNEVQALSNIRRPSLAGTYAVVDQAPQTAARGQFASVGAAGADVATQARNMTAGASPELQAAVQKAGDKVSIPVLQRHVEAESLPVPVKLTKGQATQDPALISNEQNLRGKYPEFSGRFNEQNKALIENLDAIRENAAPDVYVTSKPEVGQHVIDAYKTKDAAANTRISGLYKSLEDANGGQFPVDAQALKASADAALHKSLLYEHLPTEFRRTLDKLGNTMTFEQYEALRTNLAREMRNGSGNGPAAAGAVRQAMEELPLLPEAQGLKQMADAARQAARERFSALKADPAYNAVVMGKASADNFIQKYVIGGDTGNVQIMKENLAHDPVARQALSAGLMDQLKESGVRSGNFTQAGYNKVLDAVRPKLGILLEPEHRSQVESLGNVARYTQAQPRGSFVNNSNTTTSALAEHAKTAAEGMANNAAGGLPVGTFTRRITQSVTKGREVKKALQSGAGIKLNEVGK